MNPGSWRSWIQETASSQNPGFRIWDPKPRILACIQQPGPSKGFPQPPFCKVGSDVIPSGRVVSLLPPVEVDNIEVGGAGGKG